MSGSMPISNTPSVRGFRHTKDKLKDATKAHIDMLDNNPHRVRSYFDDLKVRYAASSES